jgi:hypothetical protein
MKIQLSMCLDNPLGFNLPVVTLDEIEKNYENISELITCSTCTLLVPPAPFQAQSKHIHFPESFQSVIDNFFF